MVICQLFGFHYLLLTNGRILDFKFGILELLAEPLVEKIQNIKMSGASEFQHENNSIIQNLKLNGKPVNLGMGQSKIVRLKRSQERL